MIDLKKHLTALCDGSASVIADYAWAKENNEKAAHALKEIERSNTPYNLNRPTYQQLADAQAAKDEAAAKLATATSTCKETVAELIKTGRESIQAEVDAFYSVDSSKVDEAFMKLADAGILTDDDLTAAFDTYADNGTMLRYVANLADEKAAKGRVSAALGDAVAKYSDYQSAEGIMRSYELACEAVNKFSCSEWSSYWDSQAAYMIPRLCGEN